MTDAGRPDLDVIEKAAERAPRGPWCASSVGTDVLVKCNDGRHFVIGDAIYHPENVAAGNMIAALHPEAVLWLVGAARQVDKTEARLSAQIAAAFSARHRYIEAEADRDRLAAELAELREAAAKMVGPLDVCSSAVRVDQLRALARLLPATPEGT